MKAGKIVLSLVCAALLWAAPNAAARSLSEQIDSLFGPFGLLLDGDPSLPGDEPSSPVFFTSSSLATAGILIKRLASGATDFPAISTVPGLTFRYDPDTQLFERSSTSLGPVFVERAQTLGRGKFDLGFSYMFVDFEEWMGNDMDRLMLTLQSNPTTDGTDTATVRFQQFTLRSHVIPFFITYGLTDRWDVNILMPLIFTSWKARARARLENGDTLQPTEQTFSGSDDKTGVGDLLLRTKYHLFKNETIHLALGSSFRLPTGEEDNFQGLGDTTFNPFLTLSQDYRRFHFHASTGLEINFDDSDRSRVRYAGGMTVQLIKQLAFLIDVIGSSNLTTDRISAKVPIFDEDAFETSPPTPSGFTRFSETLSTTIVDLAVGMKGNFGPLVGYVTFFIPLNDDGLRADWIPAVGLEASF